MDKNSILTYILVTLTAFFGAIAAYYGRNKNGNRKKSKEDLAIEEKALAGHLQEDTWDRMKDLLDIQKETIAGMQEQITAMGKANVIMLEVQDKLKSENADLVEENEKLQKLVDNQ